MFFLRNIVSGLRSLFRRERVDRELDEELRAYVEMAIEEKMKQGMSRKQAARTVRLERGSLDGTKETVRAAGWESFVETCWQDLRFALRMLRKNPGVTSTVVLTLALGIGVNTAMFSLLNGWLLRPLPVPSPEQLTVLASQQEEGSNGTFSYPDFLDFQREDDSFSSLFCYAFGIGGLSADGDAREIGYISVTGNYFSALGVKPALGRLFLPGEGEKPGEALLVVLGYSFWQNKFRGDPHVIGKSVRVNGKQATAIGVTPREFHGTVFALDMDAFLPLSALSLIGDSGNFRTVRDDRRLNVMGGSSKARL